MMSIVTVTDNEYVVYYVTVVIVVRYRRQGFWLVPNLLKEFFKNFEVHIAILKKK